jgi:hypothetical protein
VQYPKSIREIYISIWKKKRNEHDFRVWSLGQIWLFQIL